MHMTINMKLRIFCPSEKAYGSKGSGNLIPPDMDLYFDIKRVMEEENDEFWKLLYNIYIIYIIIFNFDYQ